MLAVALRNAKVEARRVDLKTDPNPEIHVQIGSPPTLDFALGNGPLAAARPPRSTASASALHVTAPPCRVGIDF